MGGFAAEFVDRLMQFVGVDVAPSISTERHNTRRGTVQTIMGRYANRFTNLNQLNTCAPIHLPGVNRFLWGAGAALSRITPRWIDGRLEHNDIERIRSVVGHHYQASNNRTSELIDVDLRRYKYDC